MAISTRLTHQRHIAALRVGRGLNHSPFSTRLSANRRYQYASMPPGGTIRSNRMNKLAVPRAGRCGFVLPVALAVVAIDLTLLICLNTPDHPAMAKACSGWLRRGERAHNW
jgi:hypothetical protein